MTEREYKVETTYTDHPVLGTWTSSTERGMNLDQALEYLNKKLTNIVNRDLSKCGRLVGMGIKVVYAEAD